MPRTVHVTPGRVSRSAAGFTAIIAMLFLVFGAIFFSVVLSETPTSEGGLRLLQVAFLFIWTVACLGIAFVNVQIFIKRKKAADSSLLDLQEDVGGEGSIGTGAFDVRLRKLESLRKDGFITEEEYQAKRTRLLEEDW